MEQIIFMILFTIFNIYCYYSSEKMNKEYRTRQQIKKTNPIIIKKGNK
jgi:hypothetical protein